MAKLPRHSSALRRSVALATLVSAFIAGSTLPAYGDQLDDEFSALQDQISASDSKVADLKTQLAEANSRLEKAQSELADAKNRLDSALATQSKSQEAADSAQVAWNVADAKLRQAEADVKTAQDNVDTQKSLVGEAARRELQQNSTLTGIAILFSNNGSASFSNRAQWASNVSSSTQRQLDAYQSALEACEQTRKIQQATFDEAESARDDALTALETAKQAASEAETAANQVAQLVVRTQAASDDANNLLAQAVADNKSLTDKQAEVSRKIDQRNARLAAEAEAAASLASQARALATSSWVTTNIAPGQLPPLSVNAALANAQAAAGSSVWEGLCLGGVANWYGYATSGFGSAIQAARNIQAAGQMHYDSDIPVGAMVFYDGAPAGNPYGHVALYAGNGMIWTNGVGGVVGLASINYPVSAWGEPLIGWSSVWLPYAVG